MCVCLSVYQSKVDIKILPSEFLLNNIWCYLFTNIIYYLMHINCKGLCVCVCLSVYQSKVEIKILPSEFLLNNIWRYLFTNEYYTQSLPHPPEAWKFICCVVLWKLSNYSCSCSLLITGTVCITKALLVSVVVEYVMLLCTVHVLVSSCITLFVNGHCSCQASIC